MKLKMESSIVKKVAVKELTLSTVPPKKIRIKSQE
jgi:hypothetical protein